jgi:hypothetical protein
MLGAPVLEQIKAVAREAIAQVERQKTVYLQDLKHPNLVLRHPLPVFLEMDDEIYIANYYDTESFGSGDSEYEALNDLCLELAQTYLDLEADQGKLGPLPSKWWTHLQTVIERRPNAAQET